MRPSYIQILGAAAIGAVMAFSAAPASAKTAKECNTEYAAQKDALKAAGTTKKAFVASCRAEADTAAPGAAAAPAAPAPAPAATAEAPTGGKTAKECNADYTANKAAIKAGGQTKKDFVASCRAGNETIPAAAPMAAPAPAPAAVAPAPMAPAPTAAAPKPPAAPSASEMQVKAKCPSDTVVWVNTKSRIYHFAGTHSYGNTKQGDYMCEMDAKATGNRAAENEKHP
jgi:hypothetical protein